MCPNLPKIMLMPHGNLRLCITASRQNVVSSRNMPLSPWNLDFLPPLKKYFYFPWWRANNLIRQTCYMFPLHAPAYHEANTRSLPSCPPLSQGAHGVHGLWTLYPRIPFTPACTSSNTALWPLFGDLEAIQKSSLAQRSIISLQQLFKVTISGENRV
jgi:hypothetical protein